jgi:hypothetical protein
MKKLFFALFASSNFALFALKNNLTAKSAKESSQSTQRYNLLLL